MIQRYLILLGFFFFVIGIQSQPTVSIEAFGPTFTRPVNIKHAGDDRLFIVEQDGLIKILNADGSVNTSPFLDIESAVSSGGERGLLGLAFHPQYGANGLFYINYINNAGNTVVSQLSVSASNSDLADGSSERMLLTFSQPFSNHNGGDLAFGPDGYLYIASGDGGSGGDPGNRAQNLSTQLGKLLRIDVDNVPVGSTYVIPNDNPFVGTSSALDEIWAYGLRNPWKFSFDSENGDLWIGDVGQNVLEEINRAPITSAGLNYGWRCFEGSQSFNAANCPSISTLTFPVAEYSPSVNNRCSITGGYRYRGTLYPDFVGLYFFADFCSNEIGFLEQNGATWTATYSERFGNNGWSAFGEDRNGELYIAGVNSGTIYKIKDATLSVEDLNATDFHIFPNPSNGLITLNFSNWLIAKDIVVYDLLGRKIYSLTNSTDSLLRIPLKSFTKGLYIVKVSDKSGNNLQKKLILK